ncbi:MAG TPA: hypothetical protein VG326_04505 [Tepidisphaeraceae bacterium]|jgi:hypothetical protein|nr:hypothetical protein [Tepidisphaeraceae bacterium]
MSPLNKIILFCASTCALLAAAPIVSAHGILGNRFFPPTLSTDDPFAVDELDLPAFSYVKNAGDPASDEVDYGFEFDKEIFPRFALGVSDAYSTIKPNVGKFTKGFGNLALTAKYEVYEEAKSEFIFSVGVEIDLGGVGTKGFRDPFTTYTPTVYLGKGFGDLPDKLAMIQPFAVTAELGQSFPTSAAAPNVFGWGFAVEYSLMYLEQHVKDVGLPAPFKDMIPLVEFSMQTTENRGVGGLTTGTVNPGVLWITDYYELGLEAAIPLNHESGAHVGVTAQLWIFIDDLFPQTFGHPLFGARE